MSSISTIIWNEIPDAIPYIGILTTAFAPNPALRKYTNISNIPA